MMRPLVYISFILLGVVSCSKAPQAQASAKKPEFGKPVSVTIEVRGGAPDVQFFCSVNSEDNSVTLDKHVNVLDKEEDVFTLSAVEGAKFQAYLKTKDSYGPEVELVVLVNGEVWQKVKGPYNPKVEGRIPFKN